jgi:hypothetical protein
MERTQRLEIGLVYGTLRTVNRRRTWPSDIRIVKGNLYTAFGDPCIRVGLCKSSCEETAEEALRVKSQSLCTRPLTDESSSPAAQQHSSTPGDRRNQPNPSWQQGTIFTKTTVSPCHHVTEMRTSLGVTQPKARAMVIATCLCVVHLRCTSAGSLRLRATGTTGTTGTIGIGHGCGQYSPLGSRRCDGACTLDPIRRRGCAAQCPLSRPTERHRTDGTVWSRACSLVGSWSRSA